MAILALQTPINVSPIIVPEEDVVLDRQSAYLRAVLSDGKERKKKFDYYFEFGDKDQGYTAWGPSFQQLKDRWRRLCSAIYGAAPAAIDPSSTPPAADWLSKPCGHEVLRKILNE